MKHFRLLNFLLIGILLSSPLNGQKSLFKKAGKVLGKVAKAGAETITAPVEAVANAGQVIIGEKKPEDIWNPIKKAAEASGDALQNTSDFVIDPQKKLYGKAAEYADKIGGDVGSFVFDVSTFSGQFYTELSYSALTSVGNTLKGENPFAIAGAPLAAAIRAARDKYYNSAQPLPKDVIEGLEGIFSPEILSKTRWTRGKVEITLPSFIGNGRKFMGDHSYAVVVEDVIVFNTTPPSFNENPWWWTHEITHVEQFAKWGVEVFAFKYLKDLGSSIESEADRKGNAMQSKKDIKENMGANFAYPISKIYSTPDQNRFAETLVTQCIFDRDTLPLSYFVTNKGNIIATDPIDGTFIQVGYSKPPNFTGALWTFWTPKINYSINEAGQILTYMKILNPVGDVIGYQGVQVGHVVRLTDRCDNNSK